MNEMERSGCRSRSLESDALSAPATTGHKNDAIRHRRLLRCVTGILFS